LTGRLQISHRFSHDDHSVDVHYLLLVIEGETMPGVVATSRIHDTFRNEHGAWLVVRHIVKIDPAMWKALNSKQGA